MILIFTLLLISCLLASTLGFFGSAEVSGIRIYLFEIISLVFVTLGLYYTLFLRRKLKIPGYLLVFFSFSMVGLISLILNVGRFFSASIAVSGLYALRFILYLTVSLIVFNLKEEPYFKSKLLRALVVSSVLVGFLGIIQLLVLPDFRVLPKELGWDPHVNRLSSAFFDPNFTGAYLVLGITLCLGLLTRDGRLRNIYLICLSFLLVCLILTFSRSSWLMVSVVVFLFGVFRSRALIFITIILMFSTYYFVPRAQTRLSGVTDPSDSARLRIVSWQNALGISGDNLITGTGFNTYRYVQGEYGFFDYRDSDGGHAGSGADSSILLVLATTGVVGLGLFMLGFGMTIYKGFRIYLSDKDALSLSVSVALVGLFVHSQFVNSLFFAPILLWMAVLMGVLSET